MLAEEKQYYGHLHVSECIDYSTCLLNIEEKKTLTINNILRLFSIAGFSYAVSSDLATLVLLALGIVVIAVRESYSNFEAINLSFCLKEKYLVYVFLPLL